MGSVLGVVIYVAYEIDGTLVYFVQLVRFLIDEVIFWCGIHWNPRRLNGILKCNLVTLYAKAIGIHIRNLLIIPT